MKVFSIEAAVELIQEHEQRKGEQRFDVSLLSGDALAKKVTLLEFGIESFYAAMDEHKTHQLTLTLRNQQGASFKYGDSFTVSSKPTPPPLPMDKSPATGNSHYMDAYFQLMLTSKDEKLHEMQRSISLLENSLKSSEKEVYELKQKNMDIERENKLKNAEFELEKRNLEVQRERDDFKKDSEGLNGLVGGVERLVANPAVVEIAKVWMASKVASQPPQLGNAIDFQIAPHAQLYVKNFAQWMNAQQEQKAKRFFNLVSILSNHDEHWDDIQSLLRNQAA